MEKFLQNKIKQVFGDKYELIKMEPLLGGAQKHTFLAECTNGFSFVIYKWCEDATYFTYDSEEAVFRSSSAILFEENNKIMIQNGVLTPKMYFIDRTRDEQNYDYAFVEYIDGLDMDNITSKYPERLPKVIKSLTNNINRLHKIKSKRVGQVGRMQDEEFDILRFSLENLFEDIDYLIPHQANIRIMESARNRLELPPEKMSKTIHKYGNTSSSSIPIALVEELEAGKIKDNDVIVMVGFGGGLTWGAMALRWGK